MFGIFGGAQEFDGVTSDSGTHGRLDTANSNLNIIDSDINTGFGTDGVGEVPANGAGVRGWLRSIYDKLNSGITVTVTNPSSSVTVTNFPATQAVSGTVAVSNFPGTQAVSATSLPLPTNAATSALQTTGNTSLASIDGKITAVNTGAVVVSSSALPTGAATATKQDTGNTSLASVDTKTPALGQALAAASVPVVLPAAQITTLTPLTSVGVNNFPATQAVSGTVSVTGVAQDATLTGGTQKTQLVDGAANALTLQTGDENAVPAYPQTKTVTQAVSATGFTAGIDTLGYTWAEVRGLAATTFSFTPQQCGDSAFATTVRSSVYYPAAQALAVAVSGTITVNGNYISNILPLQERYCRANVTVLTGGPTSIVWILHSGPIPPVGEANVSIAGTNTPQQGSGGAAVPWTVSGKAPVTSLNAAIATAAGTALDCTGSMAFPTLQVHYNVTPATVSINLEGSNNGTNWVVLGNSTSVASADFTIIPDAAHTGVSMREYRANLVTLTGASASVTALVSAGA